MTAFPPRRAVPLSSLLMLFLALLPYRACSQQLLTNGSFESGDFTGWTLADQSNPFDTAGDDHFYLAAPGSDTPAVNGFTFSTAANPLGGRFYAVTASDLPGAHALLQDFTVPLGAEAVTLSFQMFVNDQSGFGPVIDPTGLDYTTGGTFNDNQHARVDLLAGSAPDLSTTSSDILTTLYLGVDNPGGIPPNPYTDYLFDLTGLLLPGQTYRLRFAEVDNLSAINLGVDNVSLTARVAAVPEPGLLILWVSLGSGLSGAAATHRKRRRAS